MAVRPFRYFPCASLSVPAEESKGWSATIFLSAVLADRQAEAHTADKKQALDCLPPTLPKSPKRK